MLNTLRGLVKHFQSVQDLVRVVTHPDVVPPVCHYPFRIDQVRCAYYPYVRSAIKVLFTPDAVEPADPGIGVGQQRERQAQFGGESFVGPGVVGAYTQDDRVAVSE